MAADRKDIRALENIQQTLLDTNLIALANEKINLLRRRWFVNYWCVYKYELI